MNQVAFIGKESARQTGAAGKILGDKARDTEIWGSPVSPKQGDSCEE